MKDEDDDQAVQMLERLHEFYRLDPEERLGNMAVRIFQDPLKPRSDNGKFRVNPILLLLAAVLGLLISTFLFFSLGEL